jgi:hypothetical protein
MGYHMNNVKINKEIIVKYLNVLSEALLKDSDFKAKERSASSVKRSVHDAHVKLCKVYSESKEFKDFVNSLNIPHEEEITLPPSKFRKLFQLKPKKTTVSVHHLSTKIERLIKEKINENINNESSVDVKLYDVVRDRGDTSVSSFKRAIQLAGDKKHGIFLITKAQNKLITVRFDEYRIDKSHQESPYNTNKIKEYMNELEIMMDVGEATVDSLWLAQINSIANPS